MIPFVDLNAQYSSIREEIDAAIRDCIENTSFIKSRSVSDFEYNFATYLNAKNCISCGNGTDAIEIILSALKIGKGDEVIVPALTWISTAEAVTTAGAEPVFADVDPHTYTIDPEHVERLITENTKAIIPVHLYGCPADMDKIMKIASSHNIHVIEDCAQAHGAEFNGRKIGTFGIASSFSFFPSKNLGAYGDAGAIVTNDDDLADQVRKISNHGQLGVKHKHFIAGRNSRLDGIQAGILNVKLKYLDGWNRKRIAIADKFIKKLSFDSKLVLPVTDPLRKHVFHLFVLRTDKREKLIELLDDKGISWGIHYPNPVPFTDAYLYKQHSHSDFPVSSEIVNSIISIPMYPELGDDQINLICEQILKLHAS
jgi:dTDP-4-amino-4,6-dideoxygalactose transaminase